jgi:tripartite ATP-independent transporter DctP family solute receptor
LVLKSIQNVNLPKKGLPAFSSTSPVKEKSGAAGILDFDTFKESSVWGTPSRPAQQGGVMPNPTTRAAFLASSAATLAAASVVRSPASAAQFEYKLAHGTPTDMSVHVRVAEMASTVAKETGGRLNITIFPNNQLGSETAQLSQLRSGAIQFMLIQGVSLSALVSNVGMDGIGFAFKDSAQAEGAFDGPLGAYLRKAIMDKGIYALPRVFNFGMRQVTASNHPIRNEADFAGFKLRTPPAPITVDLFKTLGASPTPIVFPELYTALQTKIVDGQETPYSTISVSHLYEVQKYLSVTNHTATIFWFLANMDAWNALSPDVQASVLRNAEKAAIAQRRDTALESSSTAEKLKKDGLIFNTADVDSIRKALKPFYAKWKGEFGQTAWDLLEKTSGPLG